MSTPRLLALFGALCLASSACSSEDPPADAGADTDTGPADSGMSLDGGVQPDANADSGEPNDTGVDGGNPVDLGVDGGTPLAQELVPGSHVQVAEGRIAVMMDNYADVRGKLGPGTRNTGVGVRSYNYTLSGGVELTVWFANTNLDADDNPPNNVDDSDRVLWVAVQGNFTAQTPANVGLGTAKTAVEAAYGVAPSESPITNPAGVLAQYYTRGILVAYGADNLARTITIARSYPQAPDGTIDLTGVRLQLSGGEIRGFRGIGMNGTSKGDIMTRLGAPDAEGSASIGGQNLDTLSYAFIGIEVFFLDGGNSALFLNVHTPYYGTSSSGEGIGTGRTAFEAYLTGLGYQAAQASSNAQFFCYNNNSDQVQDVGVSYSSDTPQVVTSITFPLLSCP
ncbi:MAG: hypothetical protein IPG45_07630 [Deltaproteobacteria bacterium]|jgi:hypothetical protein|nr:hypothetical protein [Deltaproteobacteria bacterium]